MLKDQNEKIGKDKFKIFLGKQVLKIIVNKICKIPTIQDQKRETEQRKSLKELTKHISQRNGWAYKLFILKLFPILGSFQILDYFE